MALTVGTIITSCGNTLQDASGVRWTEAELIDYVNAAITEILHYKPTEYVVRDSVFLVKGTVQTIPADGVTVIDIVRNMGADGASVGPAPNAVSLEALDVSLPDWHLATPSSTVKMYAYSQLNKKSFYVYPPQPSSGNGSLEMTYAAIPAKLTTTSSPIPVKDYFQSAIVDYVLYRALSKETESQAAISKSQMHYGAFISSMNSDRQPAPQEAPK